MRGKVARNRMIDVKVTNSKLLERGLTIVEEFANCDRKTAKLAVLKAIHETDDISEDVQKQVFILIFAKFQLSQFSRVDFIYLNLLKRARRKEVPYFKRFLGKRNKSIFNAVIVI